MKELAASGVRATDEYDSDEYECGVDDSGFLRMILNRHNTVNFRMTYEDISTMLDDIFAITMHQEFDEDSQGVPFFDMTAMAEHPQGDPRTANLIKFTGGFH